LLKIALELSREGREGKPIGALFVLGDADNVLDNAQQMIMNPFKGYPEETRNALDPSLQETLKEFSLIDGAIIIRGDGVVLAAGTYLNTQGLHVDLPPGLGARHAAAAAITAVTGAVSIVISESTGTARIYKGGRSILSLKKETS
jgi:DNA integrity scanning protein DisA with diadenylate cyclase activity